MPGMAHDALSRYAAPSICQKRNYGAPALTEASPCKYTSRGNEKNKPAIVSEALPTAGPPWLGHHDRRDCMLVAPASRVSRANKRTTPSTRRGSSGPGLRRGAADSQHRQATVLELFDLHLHDALLSLRQ